MKSGRKLVVSLAVAVASAAGLMTMNVALAGAATSTQPTSDGNGQYTAITAPDFFPALPHPPFASNPCALYTRYQATLTFTGTMYDTVGTYRGPIQFSIVSNATTAWGEGPAGTFGNVTLPALPDCPPDDAAAPAKVKVITGFTASLAGTNGSQTLSCAAQAGWTYQRGNLGTLNQELNVQFKGTCNGNAVAINASIPSVPPRDPNYVASACDSLIAPSSCVYGEASSNF